MAGADSRPQGRAYTTFRDAMPAARPLQRPWQLFTVLTKISRGFHFRSGFSAIPWQLFSVLTKSAPSIWSKPKKLASRGPKSGVRDAKPAPRLVKTENSCQGSFGAGPRRRACARGRHVGAPAPATATPPSTTPRRTGRVAAPGAARGRRGARCDAGATARRQPGTSPSPPSTPNAASMTHKKRAPPLGGRPSHQVARASGRARVTPCSTPSRRRRRSRRPPCRTPCTCRRRGPSARWGTARRNGRPAGRRTRTGRG